MRWVKIVAILLVIIGIGLIGSSMYIMKQVDEGKVKIESAEKSIKQSKQLFSLVPETQGIGKQISGVAEKKIDEGKDLIARYVKLADELKIAGIVIALIGFCLFFVGRKKQSRR